MVEKYKNFSTIKKMSIRKIIGLFAGLFVLGGALFLSGGPAEGQELDYPEDSRSVFLIAKTRERNLLTADSDTVTNLSVLLSSVSLIVNGVSYQPGNSNPALYRPASDYTLSLTFRETPEKQFDVSDDGVLIFPLPQGFEVPEGYETTIDINLGRKGTLAGNRVVYNADTGNLEITWNKSDKELFDFFKASSTAMITLDIVGKITAEDNQIIFSDDCMIHVEKENLHNAIISKDGEYNRQTGNIDYTVTVVSDGTTQNLTLRDTRGTALSYLGNWELDGENSSASEATLNGVSIENPAPDSGYGAVIASMQDGEKLVFKYSAHVEAAGIGQSGNATFEETGNTATITGDASPLDNTAVHYEKDIVFSSLQKDTTGVSGKYERDGKKYRAIHWEIVTNKNPDMSLGGTKLTDVIDESVQPLCAYTGDGITVKAYESDGTLAYEKSVSWEEMGVSPGSDKSWTYTIDPEDTTPYQYIVTYDTEIDMDLVNDGGEDVFVRNTAQGKGGEDQALEIIQPDGNGISVQKQVESYTSDSVTWRITFTLSGEAYDSDHITLTEELPGQWINDKAPGDTHATLYKEMYNNNGAIVGSIEVKGLYGNETWDITGDTGTGPYDKERLTIDFYKDKEKTQKGLLAPEAGKEENRTITVLLTTKYDPEWPNMAKKAIENGYGSKTKDDYISNNYLYKHENIVSVNDAKATDSVVIQGSDVIKRVLRSYSDYNNDSWELRDYWQDETLGGEPVYRWKEDNGTGHDLQGYGGYTYPVFTYQVLVTDIQTDEPIVIEDAFDTSIFQLVRGGDFCRNSTRTIVNGDWRDVKFGGLNTYDWLAGSSSRNTPIWREDDYGSSVEETSTGVRFTIANPPKKVDGTYYNYYGVEYMLIPKDLDALKAIQKKALDNSKGGYLAYYDNTASFRGAEDSASISIPITDDFTPVDKLMDAAANSGNRVMKCVVDLNKGQLMLNGGSPMTVTDTSSDTLAVDYNSIRITTVPRGNAGLVSYDFDGHTGTFDIPDETYVRIEYDAVVVLTQEQLDKMSDDKTVNGVYVRNTVNLLGSQKTAEQTVDVDTSGYGSAEVPYVALLKYGTGHMEHGLAGAVFELYEVAEDDSQPLIPVKYAKSGTNSDKSKFEEGEIVTFRTGSDGKVDILLSQELHGVTLKYDQKYALREIKAPAEVRDGVNIEYEQSQTDYLFTITKYIDNLDQHIYMAGDTVPVSNRPKSAVLHIQKKFEGNYELTDDQKNSILFSLLRYDSNSKTYETIKKLDGEGNPTEEDDPYYADIAFSEFTDGKYDITGLTEGWYQLAEDVSASLTEDGEAITNLSCDTKWNGVDGAKDGIFYISQESINKGETFRISIVNSYNVPTVKLSVKKIDVGSGKELLGAVFDLYRIPDGEQEKQLLLAGLRSNNAGMLTDGKDDQFTLPIGEYELVETEAPEGYHILTDAVRITVSSDENGTVAVTYHDGTGYSQGEQGAIRTAEGCYTIVVANSSGFALPSAGGSGTTIFTVLGFILALGAGLLLWRGKMLILTP